MAKIPRRFLPAIALVAIASQGCYRPSDEFLARQGEKPEAGAGSPAPVGPPGEAAPAPETGPADPASDAVSDTASPPSPLGGPIDAPPPPVPQPDAETLSRDLFTQLDMKALPELDKLVGTRPGDLDSLVRGAFAGVGNDTDKCQEILLYLTVRHMHQAEALAHAAATANPEIQSFTQ